MKHDESVYVQAEREQETLLLVFNYSAPSAISSISLR